MTSHEGLVGVRAAWNHWRHAEVRLTDLHEPHWLQPAGACSSLLHAYIDCSAIVTGGIPHDCDPASAPHRLRVCVLRNHTLARLYALLAAQATAEGAPVLAP
jgi:hypothetical protein